MVTTIQYLIELGLGCIAIYLFINFNTLYRRLHFYYRISYAVTRGVIKYITNITPSSIHIDNTKIFIETLIELAKTDIIFVKVLQAISFNGNFIDKTIHDQITQFSDNVPHDTSDIDYDVSDITISNTPFIYNSNMPIRSGMISLVYELTNMETNEKYIMKVKRKNIDEKVNESIDNIMGLLYILSIGFKIWYSFDIVDVALRHIVLLREQLDFEQEEKNTMETYNKFNEIDYIRIPKIYNCEPLSGKAIIMEYLPGKHINNILDVDKAIYRDIILKYFFASSMIHYTFHGDLHSGNILFIDNEDENISKLNKKDIERPRYQIGIIDFGIVMHFPKYIPDTLFYIFEHQKNPNMIEKMSYKYIENLICPENMLDLLPISNVNAIMKVTNNTVINLFQKGHPMDQSYFYEIFKGISDNLSHEFVKKYNVRSSDGLIKLEVAISMCMSLVSHLTDGDPNKHLKRVFDEMFHYDIMFSD